MLNERCILAGFGGQGIMLMGQLLAEAGMQDGHEVSWLPSYGPEMRGGTANCAVIVSDEPVPSPVIDHNATSVVIMNLPSLAKFIPYLEKGGVALINTSLISEPVMRDDVKVLSVPCNEIALQLHNMKISNMVMLGAFVEATGCVEPESVLHAMQEKLGSKKAHLMDVNRAAFARGAQCVREQRAVTAYSI